MSNLVYCDLCFFELQKSHTNIYLNILFKPEISKKKLIIEIKKEIS